MPIEDRLDFMEYLHHMYAVQFLRQYLEFLEVREAAGTIAELVEEWNTLMRRFNLACAERRLAVAQIEVRR